MSRSALAFVCEPNEPNRQRIVTDAATGAVDLVDDAIDAELNDVYGDESEPSDTLLFDLMDGPDDECPTSPGGHVYVHRCGIVRCINCKKVVG